MFSRRRLYTRSPLEDSRLFGPSPWKILATTYETNRFLSNPDPGENLLSGNLVMETGCTKAHVGAWLAPNNIIMIMMIILVIIIKQHNNSNKHNNSDNDNDYINNTSNNTDSNNNTNSNNNDDLVSRSCPKQLSMLREPT